MLAQCYANSRRQIAFQSSPERSFEDYKKNNGMYNSWYDDYYQSANSASNLFVPNNNLGIQHMAGADGSQCGNMSSDQDPYYRQLRHCGSSLSPAVSMTSLDARRLVMSSSPTFTDDDDWRISMMEAVEAGSAAIMRRNERERNRVRTINQTFARLRQHIPAQITRATIRAESAKTLDCSTRFTRQTSAAATKTSTSSRVSDVPIMKSKKLSKVQILRAAIDYIAHLQRTLAGAKTTEDNVELRRLPTDNGKQQSVVEATADTKVKMLVRDVGGGNGSEAVYNLCGIGDVRLHKSCNKDGANGNSQTQTVVPSVVVIAPDENM